MNNIKQYRSDAGVSQRTFAAKLGVRQATIYRYECNLRKVDTGTAWKIVKALNDLGAHCEFTQVFPDPSNQPPQA